MAVFERRFGLHAGQSSITNIYCGSIVHRCPRRITDRYIAPSDIMQKFVSVIYTYLKHQTQENIICRRLGEMCIYDYLVLRFKRNVYLRQIAAENDRFAIGFDIAENQNGISLF